MLRIQRLRAVSENSLKASKQENKGEQYIIGKATKS